jgi:hypothetical protein
MAICVPSAFHFEPFNYLFHSHFPIRAPVAAMFLILNSTFKDIDAA